MDVCGRLFPQVFQDFSLHDACGKEQTKNLVLRRFMVKKEQLLSFNLQVSIESLQ